MDLGANSTVCGRVLFGAKTYLRTISIPTYAVFSELANKVVNVCGERPLNVNGISC